MSVFSFSRSFLRDHFLLMLGVCLSVYFSYHAIAGQRSLVRLAHVQAEKTLLDDEFAAARAQREVTEARVVMLRSDTLSLDYLEELAVRDLGYYRSRELALVSDYR